MTGFWLMITAARMPLAPATADTRGAGAWSCSANRRYGRPAMYENFKLCEELKPRETCIVVERYAVGELRREFHEHIPSARLSSDSRSDLLRALVIRFSEFDAKTIVRCHLNARGRAPLANSDLRIVRSDPEPGVIRFYCGMNVVAWSDQVISPHEFRRGGSGLAARTH